MITSIDELPFGERPALELLNLEDEARELPDPDYAGYGWCRVPAIELADAGGAARTVEDALLIAVHTPDDAEVIGDDLELEFDVADGAVTVLLSAFLARWLPRLRGAERAIVLCTCNPHDVAVARPAAAGGAPIWFARGDVESWLEDGRLRLTARAWQEAR